MLCIIFYLLNILKKIVNTYGYRRISVDIKKIYGYPHNGYPHGYGNRDGYKTNIYLVGTGEELHVSYPPVDIPTPISVIK